jgi:hypothetical protein
MDEKKSSAAAVTHLPCAVDELLLAEQLLLACETVVRSLNRRHCAEGLQRNKNKQFEPQK